MARKRTSVARSPEYELLGNNLTTARNNLGLSQAEAAEKIGISQGTYSGYETGTRRIKLNMIKRIAEAYGVTVDWLIGTEDLIKTIPRPDLTLSDLEYNLVVKFRELSDGEKAIVLRSVGIIQ